MAHLQFFAVACSIFSETTRADAFSAMILRLTQQAAKAEQSNSPWKGLLPGHQEPEGLDGRNIALSGRVSGLGIRWEQGCQRNDRHFGGGEAWAGEKNWRCLGMNDILMRRAPAEGERI